jgi:hypothetical protein
MSRAGISSKINTPKIIYQGERYCFREVSKISVKIPENNGFSNQCVPGSKYLAISFGGYSVSFCFRLAMNREERERNKDLLHAVQSQRKSNLGFSVDQANGKKDFVR